MCITATATQSALRIAVQLGEPLSAEAFAAGKKSDSVQHSYVKQIEAVSSRKTIELRLAIGAVEVERLPKIAPS